MIMNKQWWDDNDQVLNLSSVSDADRNFPAEGYTLSKNWKMISTLNFRARKPTSYNTVGQMHDVPEWVSSANYLRYYYARFSS